MTQIEIAPFVGVILGFVLGIWALRQGWLVLRRGAILLPHTARVALWIIRQTKGEDAVSKRYDELTEPSRLKLSGYSAICAGILLLLAGILQLIGIIQKYS